MIYFIVINGAKLGVAPVARAPPLFLPRPELKYIYVLHTSAPPLMLYVQHCFWAPIGAIDCHTYLFELNEVFA